MFDEIAFLQVPRSTGKQESKEDREDRIIVLVTHVNSRQRSESTDPSTDTLPAWLTITTPSGRI